MRRTISLAILFVASAAVAREPPRPSADDEWIAALNAADKELAACRKLGDSYKLYGDVVVRYDRKRHRWTRSASRSLDALGEKAAACVQDAIARRFHDDGDADSFDDTLEDTQRIGTPAVMLPPIATLLPVWRRAGRDAKARGELAKLLPRDYQVAADGCFKTDREALDDAEFLWLPSTGAYVPRLWDKPLGVTAAMWRAPGELVTKGRRGLCLEQVDTAKLRGEIDKMGSCWVGGLEDVLLHPRIALPGNVAYAQVSTQIGRVCALSTAGEITCCGPNEPVLPPPPRGPFTQVAAGGTFACALDAKGTATCWGAIDAPPAGPFTKLSAEYQHACGLRPSGELACWGRANYGVASAPAGTFIDVAAAQFSTCGVHRDGSLECWGEPSRAKHPPGTFTQVAADWTHACGLRSDGTIGCWRDEGGAVDSPLTGEFVEVAVGGASDACGRRKDGTIACTTARSLADQRMVPPPSGSFVQLVGNHDTFCALSAKHEVTCWGDPWPGSYAADPTWPWDKVLGLAPPPPPPAATPPGSLALSGRIVDEHGAPIAGAEVLACSEFGPCAWAAKNAVAKPATLAQLAGTTGDHVAAVTTAKDGTYRVTVKKPKGYGDEITIVATAPGREVIERPSRDPAQLTGDTALRPAVSADVDVRCDGSPCTGTLRVEISQYQWYEGTHLEKLPPGAHTVLAIVNHGLPGERRGTATIAVTYAGGAQHAKVETRPIGTGKAIRGTAPAGAHISARCGTGRPVYRSATADATGRFQLDDVGAPPCEVDASVKRSMGSVKVDHVPADVKIDLGKIPDEDDFEP